MGAMGLVLYPAKNTGIYGTVSYLIFHVTLHYSLKGNFSMWVICGSHLDCCVGQQV